MKSNNNKKLVKLDSRVKQVGGTLIIKEAKVDDSGKYLCMVNNSVGGESVETVLTVTGAYVLLGRLKALTQPGPLAMFRITASDLSSFQYWMTQPRSSLEKLLTVNHLALCIKFIQGLVKKSLTVGQKSSQKSKYYSNPYS